MFATWNIPRLPMCNARNKSNSIVHFRYIDLTVNYKVATINIIMI